MLMTWATIATLTTKAWAQTPSAYPNKPIRLVVPFTPGGSSDILGRAVAQELNRTLGQPVVVENIAGAGGSIGTERVAKSAPDGYTLLMGHIGTLAVNVSLYPKLGYDPVQSFAPLPHIKSGKLRALAVSSPQRLLQLPEVPTVAESGVAGTQGFEADQWYGVVAPAGTPEAIIKLLNEQINQALNSLALKERLHSEGAQAMPSTPSVFAKLIETEIKRWQPVIRGAGIKAE